MTVRELVFHGVVPAAAFVVPADLLGEAAARRRVLALWRPGCTVCELGGQLLLVLPRAALVRTDAAPGLPLVARGGLLLGTDLPASALAELEAPRGSAVLVRAGVPVVRSPGPAQDPSQWLELSSFTLAAVDRAEPAPAGPQLALVPATFDRGKLGAPAAVGEAAEIASLLQRPGTGATGTERPSWLRRLVNRILGRGRSVPTTALAPAGTEPGLGRRLLDRWGRFWRRLLVASRLGEVIGRRHAEYLARMLAMFERGDLPEALRHAIPLGGGEGDPVPLLSAPQPRTDLAIRPRRGGRAGALMVVPDLFAELRRIYRATFERLDAQKRHEEAAFVLAELLGANEEAVSYLERHDRLALAAELAEARGLPPGLVVRQWFIAGNAQRALQIARLKQCFGDAVARLEQLRDPRAAALRLAWADHLATIGDFAAAAEVGRSVATAGALVLAWMERAIAAGGPGGARMLAHKLTWRPEAFAETRDSVLTLLGDETLAGLPARRAFASALTTLLSPAVFTLARPTLRALVRDRGVTAAALDQPLFDALLFILEGDPLVTDVPAFNRLPAPPPLTAHRQPLVWAIAASDRGATAAHDVVFLPGGRLLVALGEAGVVLLSRRGQPLARFDVPAHRLVPSDHGDRALLLARRGQRWRVAALDLSERRVRELGDLGLSGFAPSYDGSTWAVARGDEVMLLDTLAARPEALWNVTRIGGVVAELARSATQLSFVAAGEVWSYQLPALRLASRVPLSAGGLPLAVSADGAVASLVDAEIDPREPSFVVRVEQGAGVQHELGPVAPVPYLAPRLSPGWMATPGGDPPTVHLITRADGVERARLELAGATRIAVHLDDQTVTVADDAGRLLALDLVQGTVLHDLRLNL